MVYKLAKRKDSCKNSNEVKNNGFDKVSMSG